MDWNSRRLTAVIENALNEDRATRDATSYACIDPGQRAAATIIAKQDCILAGVGCVPRILDAYATLDGAVTSHYEVTSHPSIFDGIRVHKGQHIALAGGAATALERALRNRRGNQPIEIEVRSLEEMRQALEHGAEAILLDNMTAESVREAVEICSHLTRRPPLECSGGINLENVRAYAETGVDFISVGALTHSSAAADMSMRVVPA